MSSEVQVLKSSKNSGETDHCKVTCSSAASRLHAIVNIYLESHVLSSTASQVYGPHRIMPVPEPCSYKVLKSASLCMTDAGPQAKFISASAKKSYSAPDSSELITCPFGTLPDSLLLKIWDELDPSSVRQCSATCSSLRRLYYSVTTLLRVFPRGCESSSELEKTLRPFCNLLELGLHNCEVSPDVSIVVSKLPALEVLRLHRCKLSLAGFSSIFSIKQLRVFTMDRHCTYSTGPFQPAVTLCSSRIMEEVILIRSSQSQCFLTPLVAMRFPGFTSLTLRGDDSVDDATELLHSLRYVQTLTLISLWLTSVDYDEITDDLKRSLECIRLVACTVSFRQSNFLFRFPNLRTIEMSETVATDLDLSAVPGGCKDKLQVVVLNGIRGTKFKDQLPQLFSFERARELRLSHLKLATLPFREFPAHMNVHLKILDLSFCHNLGEGVKAAFRLDRLEELDVSGSRIQTLHVSDVSLLQLQNLRVLRMNGVSSLPASHLCTVFEYEGLSTLEVFGCHVENVHSVSKGLSKSLLTLRVNPDKEHVLRRFFCPSLVVHVKM